MNDTIARSAPARGRKQQPAEAIGGTWCVGILSFDETGACSVSSGPLRLHAKRAASCLLEPAAGDSVACLRIAPDEVWIMAVLQREEGTVNVLGCGGDLTIAPAGVLQLQAARVGLKAGTLEIATQTATLATDTADVVGRRLTLAGTTVKVIGSVLSTVMDRVQHFSRHYLRTTEGIDRVAATHVEVEARQLMRLEGEHALVNGRELIKARGAQIHFG
ncbi:DUF3540 domain-containing protein [Variovorax sp. V59]|uniref:DUF3540 domain-containing protein n=2 Tax=Variovorax TaxID=34072 RepID=A0AAE3XUU9_VARPD|nr:MULTISPECIES: DUF3540 domain-containing protein [Variovorax]MBD9664686.1 DUF3540 domain-containing protein [Variovorax sp. VRV01]MDP9964273.1 hypothetical protein [Variovorax paradoxus]MDR6424990.1 hypothetical protein [Variovorax paradoxus]MDR6456392.1 hypothetical protein [Variovorax paradoxus]TWD87269.1 uncharacterized protein DUF3540 [Variovorax beijingensis]